VGAEEPIRIPRRYPFRELFRDAFVRLIGRYETAGPLLFEKYFRRTNNEILGFYENRDCKRDERAADYRPAAGVDRFENHRSTRADDVIPAQPIADLTIVGTVPRTTTGRRGRSVNEFPGEPLLKNVSENGLDEIPPRLVRRRVRNTHVYRR